MILIYDFDIYISAEFLARFSKCKTVNSGGVNILILIQMKLTCCLVIMSSSASRISFCASCGVFGFFAFACRQQPSLSLLKHGIPMSATLVFVDAKLGITFSIPFTDYILFYQKCHLRPNVFLFPFILNLCF